MLQLPDFDEKQIIFIESFDTKNINFEKENGKILSIVNGHFSAAFDLVKLLLADKQLFEDSLVRHVCIDLYKMLGRPWPKKRILIALGRLKKYGLLANVCFNKYYQPWLIKNCGKENLSEFYKVLSETDLGIKNNECDIKKYQLDVRDYALEIKKAVKIEENSKLLEEAKTSLGNLKSRIEYLKKERVFCEEGLGVFKQMKSL